MSRVLVMRGARGGVGVTTLVAALGWALHRHDLRVLMLDLDPANQLGLHFGLPAREARGWAQAQAAASDWRDAGFAVEDGLALLPYGHCTARPAPRWDGDLAAAGAGHDWLLLDAGHAAANLPEGLAERADLLLTVAAVDPACHVHLHRAGSRGWLLANRFDPTRELQRDLLLVWQGRADFRLLPQVVHEDAVVPEALARRQPLGRGAEDALAAGDVTALALWCMARTAGEGGP